MKRIAYSFFLIFAFSCGSSYPSKSCRITIQFRDSVIQDFFLLAIREQSQSLIISRYISGDENTLGSLVASAKLVRFEDIESVNFKSMASSSEILAGALGGVVAGGLTGCICTPYGSSEVEAYRNLKIGMVSGGAATVLAVFFLNISDRQYTLSNPAHIRDLRVHTFYTSEPAELQKIK